MDRRQQKTRNAIFSAFRSLLETKRYDKITVQDIIDAADVGRSTFYSHFETKDLLLDAMCEELFNHVFKNDPCRWEGKDTDLEAKLAHTLWHIGEDRRDLAGILLSDSGDVFLTYFKEHLRFVFESHLTNFPSDMPEEFILNHLTSGFAETVRWWLKEKTQTRPELVARYFLTLSGYKF